MAGLRAMTAGAPPRPSRATQIADPEASLEAAPWRRRLRQRTTRALSTLACGGIVAALAAVVTIAAPVPRFQPSSVAFLDRTHGVLAREDWSCEKAHGCAAQILASANGGATWRIVY